MHTLNQILLLIHLGTIVAIRNSVKPHETQMQSMEVIPIQTYPIAETETETASVAIEYASRITPRIHTIQDLIQ